MGVCGQTFLHISTSLDLVQDRKTLSSIESSKVNVDLIHMRVRFLKALTRVFLYFTASVSESNDQT